MEESIESLVRQGLEDLQEEIQRELERRGYTTKNGVVYERKGEKIDITSLERIALYMKCEWCGEETKDEWEIVNNAGRFKVCPTCMNLYANKEFDKLNERINKNRGETNGFK